MTLDVPVDHAVEVVELFAVLHFDDDELAFAVACE